MKPCYTCSTLDKWSKMLSFWVQDADDWEDGLWEPQCVNCVKKRRKDSRRCRRRGIT